MTRCPVCQRETQVYRGEQPTPDFHCICPPNAVWQMVAASKRGRAGKMKTAWRLHRRAMKPGEVPYWVQPGGVKVGHWGSMPMDAWALWLHEVWARRDE